MPGRRRTPNRNELPKKDDTDDKYDKLLNTPLRRSKRKPTPSTKAAASDNATCREAAKRAATECAATKPAGTSATTVKARHKKGVDNPLDIAYEKSDDSNDDNYIEGEEGDDDDEDDEDEDEKIVNELDCSTKMTHRDRQTRQKKRQDEKTINSPPHKPQPPTLAAGGVKVSALHPDATVPKMKRVKHERWLPQSSASAVSEKKDSVDSRLNICDQAFDLKKYVPISVYPFCTLTDYGDDDPTTMIKEVFKFVRTSSVSNYPWDAREHAHVSEGT